MERNFRIDASVNEYPTPINIDGIEIRHPIQMRFRHDRDDPGFLAEFDRRIPAFDRRRSGSTNQLRKIIADLPHHRFVIAF